MRRLLLLLAVLLPLPAGALEKVVLQLKWKHQFQFAGYYAALENGYYREAGLDVNIVEAGPATDPVREVLDGRAQFGVSNSALILARAQGRPVVALAVIFQHSPFILAARRNGGIRTVHDLVGKRLMIEPHAEEIADLIISRYGKRKSRDHLRYEAREMDSLLRLDLVEIGHMNPGRWKHIADTYADLGMMERDFALEGFLYDPAPRTDHRMTTAAAASSGAALILAAMVAGFIGLTRKLRREIAGRKQIEAALRESDKKFRAIADTAPVALLITRPEDGKVVYANRAAAELGGLPLEELTGSDVTRFYADPAARKRFLDELLATGTVRNQVAEFLRHDGTPVLTQHSATLGTLNEQPALFVAIADLRERERLETDLKETNAMLEHQLAEIHRLQEELRELAVRDGLTNLFNRRYLDETLERELARAKREGYPLSLVMIDIDHFKKLNDTYGHQAGDKVLRELAALLWGNIRAEDVPCRYGGEEFVVLLPRMPLDIALERAEDWRRTFQATRVPFGDFQLETTISCGLSAYPDHARTPDDLVRCCDEALYRAKRGGRNRCEIYRPAHPARR